MSQLTSAGDGGQTPPEAPPGPGGARPLTARQRRFVQEYLIDGNGTRAAARAGYSPRTANEQASQLLATLSIAEAVRAGQKELAERNKVQADDVVRELLYLAFFDPADVLDFGAGDLPAPRPACDVPPQARRAIASVKITRTPGGKGRVPTETVEYRFHDKIRAADMLARHVGMYAERPTIEVMLAMLPPNLAGPFRELIARYAAEGGRLEDK